MTAIARLVERHHKGIIYSQLGVILFFVLFVATKAEGTLQTFGRVLGMWALAIALLFPVMGAYITLSGACPMEAMMEMMNPKPNP